MKGDILADEQDPHHHYYVLGAGSVRGTSRKRAVLGEVRGQSAAPRAHRQYDLIRPLGEAHDIYALGAIFYFILTGEHTRLKNWPPGWISAVHAAAIGSRLPYLKSAAFTKSAGSEFPEPFYRDELLILILRAMVRGLCRLLVSSRMREGLSRPSDSFTSRVGSQSAPYPTFFPIRS